MKFNIVIVSLFLGLFINSQVFSQEAGKSGSQEKKKTKEEYLKDLESGTDKEKIEACAYLGKNKKEKTAIAPLIKLLENSEDPKIGSSAAVALGYIGQSKEDKENKVVKALRDKIFDSQDRDIIYNSLTAMLSIGTKNKTVYTEAKEAFQHADENYRDDIFIADLLDKIKKKAGAAATGEKKSDSNSDSTSGSSDSTSTSGDSSTNTTTSSETKSENSSSSTETKSTEGSSTTK